MRKFLLSLVFAITAIAVQAQEPAIVMTTTKSVNSQFSFGIDAVAPNTPIQIDWGNGVKENFTIGDVTEFFGFPLKGSSVKIWGEGIASLNVTSMELTALDVTRATSLTYLYIKTNQIETLDLSNCTALTFVDCSENLLTSLNLPSTSTLTAVNCDNNLLTSLNVSGATGITELTCTNNKLTFATLPIKQPSWTTYTYSPQQNFDLPKQTYITNEEIDLSSQLTVGSNTTTYTWKTASGTNLVSGTDYNVTGGKFTFLKTYTENLYCEMSNTTFPSLTLKTTKISVPPTPSVIMTTNMSVGSTFSFDIAANTDNTPIQLDWGNGTLINYIINTTNNTISSTLADKTIKIYGGNISELYVQSKRLTSIDISKSPLLKNLSVVSNELKSLDLSTNTSLTTLSCSYNPLTSLDISKNITLKDLRCGQNKLSTLDISSNIELNILYCSNNLLGSLDISKNIGLIELYCSTNRLSAIDLSNNKSLKKIECYYNLLTYLDVKNNTALTEIDCSNNKLSSLDIFLNSALTSIKCSTNNFSFTSLPIKQVGWTTYIYSPQSSLTLVKTLYALNEEVDLSSQLTANGNTSSYVWKTASGITLIKDVDYNENNGKFVFIKRPLENIYCEMRNATFPDLTLRSEIISVAPFDPVLSFTTLAPSATQQTFVLKANSTNSNVNVDWGNGVLTFYSVGTGNTNITGTLTGKTVKVYGLRITYADLTNKKINAIEVNSPAITYIDCKSNNLTFSSLPLKQQSWATYIYSPQNKVNLAKKQYALPETVDLSSELTVNGNTTNYTWKTKGGATLVAGTDYNVTGGVTTFLKVQTDSVYCQMINATFPDLTLTTTNIKVSEYPLSVGDNEVAIKVYPNPATENFTIRMAEEIVRVEVYTITGVKVFENGLYNSTTVNVPLTSMPKGALLIKAYTRNGVYSGKVVKI